jgi:hypothetical protein
MYLCPHGGMSCGYSWDNKSEFKKKKKKGVTRGNNLQKHRKPQIIGFSSAKRDIGHWNSIE